MPWNRGDMISYLMQTDNHVNRNRYERTLKRCIDWAFDHRLYFTLHKMISSGDDLCLKHSLLKCLSTPNYLYFINYLYLVILLIHPLLTNNARSGMGEITLSCIGPVKTICIDRRIFDEYEEQLLIDSFCKWDSPRILFHYEFVIKAIVVKVCLKSRIWISTGLSGRSGHSTLCAMLCVDSSACIEQYGHVLLKSAMGNGDYGMAKLLITCGAPGNIGYQRRHVQVRSRIRA